MYSLVSQAIHHHVDAVSMWVLLSNNPCTDSPQYGQSTVGPSKVLCLSSTINPLSTLALIRLVILERKPAGSLVRTRLPADSATAAGKQNDPESNSGEEP